MPTPPAAPLILEVITQAHMVAAGGRQVPDKNIFHYMRTGTLIAPSKTAFITAFQTNVLAFMAAALNVRWAMEVILCRWLDDATDQYIQVTDTSVGAIATDSYDSRSAVYMQFRSGFRGRNWNGSKHFGPLSEIDTTGDILTGAGLARFQTLQAKCALQFTDLPGQVYKPVVFSRTLSQVAFNPTNVLVSDVTSVALNKSVGSMKRRRAGSTY